MTKSTDLKTGGLCKLTIVEASPKPGKVAEVFQAMFNPREYSLVYDFPAVTQENAGTTSENVEPNQTQGEAPKTGKQSENQSTRPGKDQFAINLILDGTSANQVSGGQIAPVRNQVAKLFSVAFDNGVAKLLNVSWGEALDHECKLGKVGINYKLFDRDGEPLRAELALTFYLEKQLEEKLPEVDTKKPTTTNSQVVLGDADLRLMTTQAYGSSEMYLEVASYNGLDDFRNLEPGTTLVFPPLSVLQNIIVTASSR